MGVDEDIEVSIRLYLDAPFKNSNVLESLIPETLCNLRGELSTKVSADRAKVLVSFLKATERKWKNRKEHIKKDRARRIFLSLSLKNLVAKYSGIRDLAWM